MTDRAAGAGVENGLRVALGEYDTGWHDAPASLARAEEIIANASRAGVQLVVLPETFTTGFTMEVSDVVEEEEGPSMLRMLELGRRYGVSLIGGLATRGGAGCSTCYHNTAVVVDRSGRFRGRYRKQKLFGIDTGASRESKVYTPGDRPLVVELEGVRIGVFICFDLRFPELFRMIAREVHAMVVIANWPAARRTIWDTLLRARAIENQCYVIGVNRTGTADGLEYAGGSVVVDPWGTTVSGKGDFDLLVGQVDPRVVAKLRAEFPVGLG